MRIRDPFREAGWWFRVSEYCFELQCTCGITQRADALTIRVNGEVTLYDCPNCGAALIGIGADEHVPVAGAPPLDDDGHRMCGFVFGSAVDMTLAPPGAAENILEIPARPRFFSARNCA